MASNDCAVLFTLYAATNGPQWSNSFGWNETMTQGTNCCLSFGVGCTDGKVTSLDLSGNNLSGTLPEIFTELESLKSLDLSENTLGGAIPTSLYDLLDDAQVDLRNNQFMGVVPDMGLSPGTGGSCLLDGNPNLACTLVPNQYCSFGRTLPLCETPAVPVGANVAPVAEAEPAAVGPIGNAPTNRIAAILDGAEDADAALQAHKEMLASAAPVEDPAVQAHRAMLVGAAPAPAVAYGDDTASLATNIAAAQAAAAPSPAAGTGTSGQNLDANRPSSPAPFPLGAVIGGAVALLVLGAVVPATVLALRRRRRARQAELESGKPIDSRRIFGRVHVGGPRRAHGVDIPSSFERGSSRGKVGPAPVDGFMPTSNVRRFNVDGAYPGMPGLREDRDDRPAFRRGSEGDEVPQQQQQRTRRGSAPQLPVAGARPLQLQDPIMERASEDLARDLEEAGAARSSESPYSTPASSGAFGFFSRMMMGGSQQPPLAPVSTEDDDEAAETRGHEASTVPRRGRRASEGVTAAGGAGLDATKSLWSHQTQHEVREGMVQQVSVAGGAGTGARSGSYTGFGMSAAKKAAARAKKGRGAMPVVTPTRNSSL
ncbi:hypothetical protein HDU96_010175 [Phlyctochytrium bullatum]|nr:hypothetical protein HDU96_010175 [Phlyctochytrium bullatum]